MATQPKPTKQCKRCGRINTQTGSYTYGYCKTTPECDKLRSRVYNKARYQNPATKARISAYYKEYYKDPIKKEQQKERMRSRSLRIKAQKQQ